MVRYEVPAALGPVAAAAFSADGARIATGHRNGAVAIWRTADASLEQIARPAPGDGVPVYAITFDPQGAIWAVLVTFVQGGGGYRGRDYGPAADSTHGRMIRIGIDAGPGFPLPHAPEPRADDCEMLSPFLFGTVSFSPDGRHLVYTVGGVPSTVELATSTVRHFPMPPGRCALTASFGNGGRVLVGGKDRDKNHGWMQLWSLDGTLMKSFAALRGEVAVVALSLDGKRAAATTREPKVLLADPATGDPGATVRLEDVMPLAAALAFSPDGSTLLVTDVTNRLLEFDAVTGVLRRAVQPKPAPSNVFHQLRFSDDGARVLSTALGELHVWRL